MPGHIEVGLVRCIIRLSRGSPGAFTCSETISDDNIPVAFVNNYDPIWDNDAFFNSVFSKLTNMSTYFPITGGDFNCWVNPELDHSSAGNVTPSKWAKAIQSFMDDFSVSDPWRFFNPTGRAYSFFSNVHHTFTHINYFLLDILLLPSVHSCSNDAIVISDHAPVILELQFKACDFTVQ